MDVFLQDEFWSRVVRIWVISFSFGFQLVLDLTSEHFAPLFFVCVGRKPDSHPGHNITRNLGLSTVSYFSVATYFVYYVSVQIYKRKTKFKGGKDPLCMVEKDSLADFYSSLCYLTSVFGHAALIAKLSSTIRVLDQYPNYLYLYFMHHVSSFLFCGSISAIYYLRHKNLRQTVIRKLKARLATKKIFLVDE